MIPCAVPCRADDLQSAARGYLPRCWSTRATLSSAGSTASRVSFGSGSHGYVLRPRSTCTQLSSYQPGMARVPILDPLSVHVSITADVFDQGEPCPISIRQLAPLRHDLFTSNEVDDDRRLPTQIRGGTGGGSCRWHNDRLTGLDPAQTRRFPTDPGVVSETLPADTVDKVQEPKPGQPPRLPSGASRRIHKLSRYSARVMVERYTNWTD